MSIQSYTLDRILTVSDANIVVYLSGVLHPDRIMKEHDFVYIMEGEWEICQDGTRYLLKPDDVILLHAGVHHYGLIPCISNTKTMYLHFEGEEGDFYGEKRDGKTVCLETVIHARENPKVKFLFSEIVQTSFERDTFGNKEKLSAQLRWLLLELYRCCSAEKITKGDFIIEEIIHFFRNNPDKNFTLRELSELFYMNEKTLDRHFRRAYGVSVVCFQREMKLESMKRYLLEYPTAPLKEVALNFGFCDEFHLSKVFKKQYGISPQRYRKEHT